MIKGYSFDGFDVVVIDCENSLSIISKHDGLPRGGVVNADLYYRDAVFGDLKLDGFTWYIARALVPDNLRGTGVGSCLISTMLRYMREEMKNADHVMVSPGGYSGDIDRQVNFYKKNGFKEIENDLLFITVKGRENGEDRRLG